MEKAHQVYQPGIKAVNQYPPTKTKNVEMTPKKDGYKCFCKLYIVYVVHIIASYKLKTIIKGKLT